MGEPATREANHDRLLQAPAGREDSVRPDPCPGRAGTEGRASVIVARLLPFARALIGVVTLLLGPLPAALGAAPLAFGVFPR